MRDTLYWLVLAIVLVGAGSGMYLKYQDTRPCVHPVTFALGAVDSRFEITNAALIAEAKAAAAIWNTAEGKTLLAYDPKSDLKISLIYDAREETAKLGTEIARRQAEEDAARTSLEVAQTELVAQQSTYNQTVNTINARGGATQREVAALDAERASLNQLTNSINSKVADFNASIKALNIAVNEYNQTAGHTFEQGRYVRDATGERISIFEFVGKAQLERVLAHEFGHALGLDHNSNPKSIMYAKNESGNLVPTTADLSALKAICGS